MAEQLHRSVSIGTLARELGVSASTVRLLTNAGVLPSSRTQGGHRRYDLDAAREAWERHRGTPAGQGSTSIEPPPLGDLVAERTDQLDGLEESEVWLDIVPSLGLDDRPRALAVARYAFTEMLNNAIDHSDGTQARSRAWRSDDRLSLEIADDGIGIYQRLSSAMGLPDLFAAVAELTKGKRTTAPEAHTGEGIFFTSKAVDRFRLDANGITWIVDSLRKDHAVGQSPVQKGTVVRLDIDPHTRLDLGALFREFSDDHEFTRSRPVIKLFSIGVDFVSRSEAKRLLTGMEKFTEVELDFGGVNSVGQGFVDEVFRVWPSSHPGTELTPTNMNPAVEFMVNRGLPRP